VSYARAGRERGTAQCTGQGSSPSTREATGTIEKLRGSRTLHTTQCSLHCGLCIQTRGLNTEVGAIATRSLIAFRPSLPSRLESPWIPALKSHLHTYLLTERVSRFSIELQILLLGAMDPC
jgi:hypothetical protein